MAKPVLTKDISQYSTQELDQLVNDARSFWKCSWQGHIQTLIPNFNDDPKYKDIYLKPEWFVLPYVSITYPGQDGAVDPTKLDETVTNTDINGNTIYTHHPSICAPDVKLPSDYIYKLYKTADGSDITTDVYGFTRDYQTPGVGFVSRAESYLCFNLGGGYLLRYDFKTKTVSSSEYELLDNLDSDNYPPTSHLATIDIKDNYTYTPLKNTATRPKASDLKYGTYPDKALVDFINACRFYWKLNWRYNAQEAGIVFPDFALIQDPFYDVHPYTEIKYSVPLDNEAYTENDPFFNTISNLSNSTTDTRYNVNTCKFDPSVTNTNLDGTYSFTQRPSSFEGHVKCKDKPYWFYTNFTFGPYKTKDGFVWSESARPLPIDRPEYKRSVISDGPELIRRELDGSWYTTPTPDSTPKLTKAGTNTGTNPNPSQPSTPTAPVEPTKPVTPPTQPTAPTTPVTPVVPTQPTPPVVVSPVDITWAGITSGIVLTQSDFNSGLYSVELAYTPLTASLSGYTVSLASSTTDVSKLKVSLVGKTITVSPITKVDYSDNVFIELTLSNGTNKFLLGSFTVLSGKPVNTDSGYNGVVQPTTPVVPTKPEPPQVPVTSLSSAYISGLKPVESLDFNNRKVVGSLHTAPSGIDTTKYHLEATIDHPGITLKATLVDGVVNVYPDPPAPVETNSIVNVYYTDGSQSLFAGRFNVLVDSPKYDVFSTYSNNEDIWKTVTRYKVSTGTDYSYHMVNIIKAYVEVIDFHNTLITNGSPISLDVVKDPNFIPETHPIFKKYALKFQKGMATSPYFVSITDTKRPQVNITLDSIISPILAYANRESLSIPGITIIEDYNPPRGEL